MIWVELAVAGEALPAVVEEALAANTVKQGLVLAEAGIEGSRLDERPWILLYAGELRRLVGDPEGARAHFEAVALDFPASPARDPARLGMAMVDLELGKGGNASAALALFATAAVPPSLDADRWIRVAQDRVAQAADPTSIREAIDLAEAAAKSSPKEAWKRQRRAIDQLRVDLGAAVAAPQLALQTDEGLIRAVRAAIDGGDLAKARGHATDLLAHHPDSAFAEEARYAVRRAEVGALPDRAVVALLLPLSGAYALPAAGIKKAAELGNRALGEGARSLRTHDTGGTGAGCVAALEKAVFEQHAAAVLGPLTREEAVPCAKAAQAMHVPMLGFSNSDDPLAAGDMIFRASPSTPEQVAALVDLSAGSRGILRYAVAHPSTAFGENAARAFRSAVEARGGHVILDVPYDPATKDYRGVASHLARRSGDHRYDVAGAPKQAGGSRVDWDALFVPDAFGRVALLASALAAADVPIGNSRGSGDRMPVTLLGLSAWNSPEWPKRGGPYIKGCLFVDAWDPRSARPGVQRFASGYGGEATVVEAGAYDAAQVLGLALAADGPVATALMATSLPDSATGVLGMGEGRALRRDFQILSVEGDQIVTVGSAPGSP